MIEIMRSRRGNDVVWEEARLLDPTNFVLKRSDLDGTAQWNRQRIDCRKKQRAI